MKRSVLFFLTVALLACAAAAANDQGGLGTLAGTVVGPTGKPIVGARVSFQGADGSHPDSTVTNEQGRFFFPQIPHGYYDLRAYHHGAWSEWKHNIEVNTGKQTEVTLRVPGKQKKSK